LIREFPEDLGIKEAISATQGSSLFYFEQGTPSLVYAIFEWFSHWSKFEALPYCHLSSTGGLWVLLWILVVRTVALVAWVLRLKAVSMTCFF